MMVSPCNENVQQPRLRLWCFKIFLKIQYSKIQYLKLSFAPLRILQELETSWLTQKATPHFQLLCPKLLLGFDHHWC